MTDLAAWRLLQSALPTSPADPHHWIRHYNPETQVHEACGMAVLDNGRPVATSAPARLNSGPT